MARWARSARHEARVDAALRCHHQPAGHGIWRATATATDRRSPLPWCPASASALPRPAPLGQTWDLSSPSDMESRSSLRCAFRLRPFLPSFLRVLSHPPTPSAPRAGSAPVRRLCIRHIRTATSRSVEGSEKGRIPGAGCRMYWPSIWVAAVGVERRRSSGRRGCALADRVA